MTRLAIFAAIPLLTSCAGPLGTPPEEDQDDDVEQPEQIDEQGFSPPALGPSRTPSCVEAADCEDGNRCTIKSCADGFCAYSAVDPSDENPCTADSCVPDKGPVHEHLVFDDGDACTVDVCNPETGDIFFEPVRTDDQNPCTVDSCDLELGVIHAPNWCDDQTACTDDACDLALGCVHEPVVYFSDSFDYHDNWELDSLWQIDQARHSQVIVAGFGGDPGSDHSGGPIAGVLGAGVGRNLPATEGTFSATSQVIGGVPIGAPVFLEFWHVLDGDADGDTMRTSVEVFDGKDWKVVWAPTDDSQFSRASWTRTSVDISDLVSPDLRVRISHQLTEKTPPVGGLTVDDLRLIPEERCP